jgi:hypothetical protein
VTSAIAPASTPHVIDPRDPPAGAELLEEQVAGHLEQEVRQEENAGAESEYRCREVQLLDHLERGESQVDPVEKGNEIADHQERHDAQRHPAHRPRFQRIRV